MTNREIIAEVVNDLRAQQVDDRISERYVLSKLKNTNALFLKRENDKLRLYDDNNVWFLLECLEMESLDPKSYPDGCKGTNTIGKIYNYTRSKYPIPQIYSAAVGPLVREVQTMDDSGLYQPTTPAEYAKIINREYRNPNIRYYWFDGSRRLVIPNSQATLVTMNAAFRDPWQVRLIDACRSTSTTEVSTVPNGDVCGPTPTVTSPTMCPEPLDDPFLCPEHLLSTVKESATKDLFEFYKRVITDPVSDNDNNSKQDRK